ncbi:hypothetical protein THAOC_11777 [Thalassiosira oceanica]|uniref:Leucine-rich repeat domain-containing protein n=1 Tax=Thalassiosira oceanica TaxID=159749 RepID=K0SLS1_THAOC|nr:hypothetical protein THAOC_11777 [Thalassiosira oceanica]|eukprot:EJK67223.1 hypothetical protein THAOC_11777 [Thalassiosira oceanica]
MDDDDASGRKRKCDTQFDNVFLYYKGGNVAEGMKSQITQVRIGPQVKHIPHDAFRDCINLAEVQFGEGSLEVIGDDAFRGCKALQEVVIPPSVTKLGDSAFRDCSNLAEVQFRKGLEIIEYSAFKGCKALQQVIHPSSVTKNVARSDHAYECHQAGQYAFSGCGNLASVQFGKGLEIIGEGAFDECTALRGVTVPSSVTELGYGAFGVCTNLTEVILLGGERLLNQGFLDRGLLDGERALNRKKLHELIGYDAFPRCPLTTLKISIPRALCYRMERLPRECRLSIEQRVHDLRRLELTQDGNILTCFPLLRRSFRYNTVEDTNDETAESLHQILRLISFHELKESSILIELAMWKSRLDEVRARADCRTSVPDPAKSLIMDYCGFTGFLKPAIEGA